MTNGACDCCDKPLPFRVELQYVSFARECDNRCFFLNNGIFYNKMSGSAKLVGDASAIDGYTAHYERNTSASIEFLDPSNTEENCQCEQSYNETQESSYTYNAYNPILGNLVYTDTMQCNGSRSYEECPFGRCEVGVENALVYGVGVSGSTTYTHTDLYDPSNNTTSTENFGENCEIDAGCVAPTWTNPTFEEKTPFDDQFSGSVAECDWDNEYKNPHFPDFLNVTCIAPITTSGACFTTDPPPDVLPNGEGYASSAYKFYDQNNKRRKSERFCKYRIVHNPTTTCYLKLWITKKITNYISTEPLMMPYIIDNVEYETIEYEWTGETIESGKCLKNNTSWTDVSNLVISQDFDLNVGDVEAGNGKTVELAIKKMSIIKGYEPDDPTEGYPYVSDISGRCNADVYPNPICQ